MKNSTTYEKIIFTTLIISLLMLLFIYTSVSKFLDYDKFVFQMRLAPVPLMKILAPALGWLVPGIEMLIAIGLAAGFFYPNLRIMALYSSVILLIIFEIYIGTMLLSGSHLPCTCGGIISKMGWQQHLLFNAFFIITGIISIRFLPKKKLSINDLYTQTPYKDLSRA
ncbi:MauE/DoxX family redox-associated membrane protein [Mucilaginibacter sp. UYCu711]|uniref:MauE/DoxX family redox-associated membrane protein n=1 Tax=Mucilaginibacter sp. UYCu711 TaxID=3156339 RepID=UPI003D237125